MKFLFRIVNLKCMSVFRNRERMFFLPISRQILWQPKFFSLPVLTTLSLKLSIGFWLHSKCEFLILVLQVLHCSAELNFQASTPFSSSLFPQHNFCHCLSGCLLCIEHLLFCLPSNRLLIQISPKHLNLPHNLPEMN